MGSTLSANADSTSHVSAQNNAVNVDKYSTRNNSNINESTTRTVNRTKKVDPVDINKGFNELQSSLQNNKAVKNNTVSNSKVNNKQNSNTDYYRNNTVTNQGQSPVNVDKFSAENNVHTNQQNPVMSKRESNKLAYRIAQSNITKHFHMSSRQMNTYARGVFYNYDKTLNNIISDATGHNDTENYQIHQIINNSVNNYWKKFNRRLSRQYKNAPKQLQEKIARQKREEFYGNSGKVVKRFKKAYKVAKSKLGTPYSYGANGPYRFDCSSFVQYVFRKGLDKYLPRVAQDQYDYSKHVPFSKARLGDLVFFGSSASNIGHVGIYLGKDLMIDDQLRGTIIEHVHAPWWHLVGVGRII